MNESNNNTTPKRRGKNAKAAASTEATSPRATRRKKADAPTTTAFLEYQDWQADLTGLFDAVKADFRKEHKRMHIDDMKVYIKPEDGKAYYMINGEHSGSIDLK